MKGCLNVTVNRIGKGVNIKAKRIGKGVNVNITKLNKNITIDINRIGSGITVTCGLICSVNKLRYIKVEPKSIFLMPGNNFTDEVLIMSNVNWIVK